MTRLIEAADGGLYREHEPGQEPGAQAGGTSTLTTKGNPPDPAALANALDQERTFLRFSTKFKPGENELLMARNEDLRMALERGVEAYQMVEQAYREAHFKMPDRAAIRASVEQLFPSKDLPGS